MAEQDIPVRVVSGYGGRTRVPFVTLVIGDKMHQMAPDEARRVAGLLMECAEAADQDAFMVEWFQRKFEMPIEQAAGILLEFRQAREGQT